MTCPVCHKPAKPIIVHGIQARNYRGELMWHCCGIYPPITLKPKEEPMNKPGKRKVKK